ncbi:MAG: hypothetical protein AAF600_17720 [Bacteroidota bacterium]
MKLKRGYVAITSKMRDSLNSEINRTGVGPQKLLRGNKEARSIGLTSGIIYCILGKTGHSKSCKESLYNLALALWVPRPNKDVNTSIQT